MRSLQFMKRITFTILALLLPLALLLVLEGGLRLAGVGAEGRDAFILLPGQTEQQALNPNYVTRYFQGFAPSVAFHPFAVTKTPETFRVLVLGGSSTAGFPYHFYHSFAEPLRDHLQRAAPERVIEVVNLGMSAVNSYTLWDLRHALVEAEPDAVVIYAGHNEYYGAFGAGSSVNNTTGSIALKRLTLRLQRFALYTALRDLLTPAPTQAPRQTMMARVVADAAITMDADAFTAGLAQYEANMGDLLAVLSGADVPVFIGLVTSNLKDQAPLGDEETAQLAFDEGTRLLAAGDTTAATAAFLEAKEQDGLRFRAPEAINATLHRLVEGSPATLVDVPAVAQQGSASGIPDATFFDDHLHPNAIGHAALATAFAEAMATQWPWIAASNVPLEAVLDPIEATYAALQVGVLEAGYPFNKTRTLEETQAATRNLLERTRRRSVYDSLAVVMATEQVPPPRLLREGLAYARQTGDTLGALQLYRALLHWRPSNAAFAEEAVGFAANIPTWDALTEPLAAFAWAKTREPSYLNTWAAISLRQAKLDQTDRLLATTERLIPNDPVMLFNKARLLVIQGDTATARTYFERYRQAR